MLSSLTTYALTGLGIASAAGLAVGCYFYASLWPASQLFGKTLIAVRRPDEIAITFDDGPNPAWTPKLLEILALHDVKATFFLVGQYAAAQPELVQRLTAEGHQIGNHSWSHANLARLKEPEIREELRRTQLTLEEISGQPVRLFRPPFGSRKPAVLRVACELGLTSVMWNAMTSDWKERDGSLIVSRLMAKVERNTSRGFATNLVLHDGSNLDSAADRGPSITAIEQLIVRIKARKKFVTIDQWK